MLSRFALAALALAFAGACTDSAAPDGPAITGAVSRLEIPLFSAGQIDLLFVIDNSPAMAPQRAKLLSSYRHFIEALESLSVGRPDLHIGVVTTDLGTRGAHDNAPGPSIGTGPGSCTSEGDRGDLRRAPAVDGNYLFDYIRPDGTRARNYTGSLADAFVQLADVGTSGCAYPRPLEAMRRVLADNPANTGFLRARAFLAIVFLTNDDDCSFAGSAFAGTDLDRSRCTANPGSLVAIDEYANLLASLKSDPVHLRVLGGFAPPSAPACADAKPAPRLAAVLDRFPNRSHTASICEPNIDDAITPILQLPKSTLGVPCFTAPLLDVDPLADGLQPDCAAWYTYRDHGEPVEELFPACRGDGPGPCWQIGFEPQICVTSGQRPIFRDQHRSFEDGANARAIIECVSR